ncbi:hypothetical protein Tco_1274654, partial [Tanacetum coccineum]
ARIRRIFLDGYGVLVFRIVIFKISSFKLQNARLLLIFTKYSIITTLFDVITMVLVLYLREITPVVPLIPTFIVSEGSLIVSNNRTPTVSDQVTNSLTVCALYSALAIVVKLALVAQW